MNTINPPESFIMAEQPLISGLCPLCQGLIKKTTDEQGLPVFLSAPYQIRTIKIIEGSSYEVVNSRYLHDCSVDRLAAKAVVATLFGPQSNGVRSAVVPVTTLL